METIKYNNSEEEYEVEESEDYICDFITHVFFSIPNKI